jgi:branched-chain amino acid transport system substrate-binding protein
MRARRLVAPLCASTLLALLAGCGGSRAEPFRIGILSDCYGPFQSAHELIAASAELPLIERGARKLGSNPSDGVDGAEVAGRPVQLLIGCVANVEDVIPEARRLVDEEGVHAVVGPLNPEEGMVLRKLARRRPETAFLIQPSGAPELTLVNPARNVFRFVPDSLQYVAGLGSYAYHDLGWRTAAIVADDVPYGWEEVAGFVAEFCALGGRVIAREWVPPGANPATTVSKLPAGADGAYAPAGIAPMLDFLDRYRARHPDLARSLVSNGTLLYDPSVVARARGVVVASSIPFELTPATGKYVASFARAFPRIPAASALNLLAVPYRDGVEAVLEALDRSNGDDRQLMASLAALTLNAAAGPVRLDDNRQAVAANYLSQVRADRNGRPAIATVRVVPNVEQTFGGYFKPTDAPPSKTTPACVKRRPPSWARR